MSTVAVTGASGYVGGLLVRHLTEGGQHVVALQRRPGDPGTDVRPYELGATMADGTLDGVEVVVHTAHDFTSRGAAVAAVNVAGSMPLLDAAHRAGVRVVLISTLSAFRGCRSAYGQAKLALEEAVRAAGGQSLRAGVVFGPDAGGIFGSMVAALGRSRFTPLFGGGRQRLMVTHDRALQRLVAMMVGDASIGRNAAVLAANDRPTDQRTIAAHIAHGLGRPLVVVPVPWRAGWVLLRAGEVARLPVPFRSDSLLALAHPMPLNQLAQMEASPVTFPELRSDLWTGS